MPLKQTKSSTPFKVKIGKRFSADLSNADENYARNFLEIK